MYYGKFPRRELKRGNRYCLCYLSMLTLHKMTTDLDLSNSKELQTINRMPPPTPIAQSVADWTGEQEVACLILRSTNFLSKD